MNRFSKMATLFVVAWLLGEVNTASAAWNNVFQTCCHGCRSRASSSFFAPCPDACPTVTYQQRSFYQPVTTYRMESYLEPVTTYRRSFRWEPTTSFRYTSYYDPCTGCCQQVATPVTSYRLRSECNPVVSYVQRCRMVPQTVLRQSFYLEPVVTYSSPVPDCPPATVPAPTINESNNPGAGQRMPSINEGSNNAIPKQNIGSGPGVKYDRKFAPPPSKSPVRMDRTASRSKEGQMAGMVLMNDRITPQSGATLRFVSREKNGPQHTINADEAGQFQISLPAGEWLMYVTNRDGQSEFHSRIELKPADDRYVSVVCR